MSAPLTPQQWAEFRQELAGIRLAELTGKPFDPQRRAELNRELARSGLPIAAPAPVLSHVTDQSGKVGPRSAPRPAEAAPEARARTLSEPIRDRRQTTTTTTPTNGNGRGYGGRKPVTDAENRSVTTRATVTAQVQTAATTQPAAEPAPPIEPVELVRRIAGLLQGEVVMTREQALFAALWVLFSHAHESFETSPILAIVSATKRSGKTRLLERLEALVPSPLAASSATPATIFRVIEKRRPTLLLDELDMADGDQAEFNRILVSGLRRWTAFVLRCVGDQYEPKQFSTWCPKVLCRIGDIRHGSLNDRAIVVRLARADPDEVDRLRSLDRQTLATTTATLRAQAAEWAAAYGPGAGALEPEQRLPMRDSRYRDLWAPLLAIVDMIGEPSLVTDARAAALALYDERETATDEQSIRLLTDIRDVFEQRGSETTFLPSSSLVSSLREEAFGLWATYGERGLNVKSLAYLLRSFGLKPEQRREGSVRTRGYTRDAIEAVIRKYAPAEADGGDE